MHVRMGFTYLGMVLVRAMEWAGRFFIAKGNAWSWATINRVGRYMSIVRHQPAPQRPGRAVFVADGAGEGTMVVLVCSDPFSLR
jgi:hypothetical protein